MSSSIAQTTDRKKTSRQLLIFATIVLIINIVQINKISKR